MKSGWQTPLDTHRSIVAVRSLEPEGDVGTAAEISEGDVEGDTHDGLRLRHGDDV
jgi:hypothetical protein